LVRFYQRVYLEDICRRANKETKAIPYGKNVSMSGDELVRLSKENIQFIEATFSAYKNKQHVFTIKSIDSSLWVVNSEGSEIIEFFKKKFTSKEKRG
jgi:hypothetical protein